MKKDQTNPNILKVLGIALSLPSYILGISWICYYLVNKKIITAEVSLGIFLSVMFYSIYLMVKYATRKSNKD